MAAGVTLYTRAGCHLCDEARELLRRAGASWNEVDVDADETLLARFGERVPVVARGERILAEGNLEGVPLARLLEA